MVNLSFYMSITLIVYNIGFMCEDSLTNRHSDKNTLHERVTGNKNLQRVIIPQIIFEKKIIQLLLIKRFFLNKSFEYNNKPLVRIKWNTFKY